MSLELGQPPPQQPQPPWKQVIFYKTPIIRDELDVNPKKGSWKDLTPQDLIELKDSIGPKENDNFDLIKRITNPYELIFTNSNNPILPPSVALLKPLSRSFFKLIEMLDVMKFFEHTSTVLKYKTLHLCEGPGGFIEAFLDRAEQYKKTVKVAHAMTLKQTNNSIPGWRAAARLLSRHPEIHIEYGPNSTGNILEEANQEYLETILNRGAHLVTADGGFDFSVDFSAQEKHVFPLLVASTLVAFSCLAPTTGCFILKIFDSFSIPTQQFLAICSIHFKEWTIYKPVTSRPCNSERYFLGKGFLGFSESSKDLLKSVLKLNTNITSIWESQEQLQEVLNLINLQTQKYVEEQKAALSYVLSFSEEESIKTLWKEQKERSLKWCNTFRIPAKNI
jgi:23S rRNA U2552 (ribose-2'-O)-methylase RlmE/FtsJ